jgi:hypothetical protein
VHAAAALPPAPTAVAAGVADAVASRRGGGLDAARVAVADLGLDGAAGFWLSSAVEAAADGQ